MQEDDLSVALSLDVGCGARHPEIIKRHFPNTETVGVDIRKYKGVTIVADAQYLPYQNVTFDNVLIHHVLEHVRKDTLALKEIHRVLKKGGNFRIIVPNYYSHRQILFRFLVKRLLYPIRSQLNYILGKKRTEVILRSLYHSDSTHYREYTLTQITSKVENAGFRITNIQLYGIRLPSPFSFFPLGQMEADRWHAGKYSHSILIDATS